jgi:DNA-binding FrmR family transcriptional regulator
LTTSKTASGSACDAQPFVDEASRRQVLNRLKRAEGQLRGIQRMIEEGQPCLEVASQMAAVRKALDSTYSHMVTCYVQSELASRLSLEPQPGTPLAQLMTDLESLLGKVR